MKKSVDKTSLAYRMRKLADTGHPRAEELRAKADAFDRASTHFFSVCNIDLPVHRAFEPSAGQLLLEAWKEARRLYNELTKPPRDTITGHNKIFRPEDYE